MENKREISDKGMLFDMWAYYRVTDREGSSVLVHAAHHLYMRDALDQSEPLIPALVANGEYHRYLILLTVIDAVSNVDGDSGYDLSKMTDRELAADLGLYEQRLEDEPIHLVQEAVHELRQRMRRMNS